MDKRLGEAYFDARARLGTAVYALSQLASELDVHPSRVSLLQNLLANLREPFLFVVAGEVNAGKSTLLNALFGEDFCKADVVPTTAQICLFKYGTEPRNIPVSDTLIELYRPNDFLKDFNIVDTPGTNSIVHQHQDITERFIPMSDLVIFTFSVTNPWGGTAWALLDKIHTRWFKNIVFVLQQCDLRNDDEIAAIVEHIRVTARQRLGTDFPIYAVSAKQAYLSKTSSLDTERLWRQSGFQNLEDHISKIVNSTEVRHRKLGNAIRSAQVVLQEVRQRLSAAAEIVRADEELIGGLDRDVRTQRQRTLEKFAALFRSLDSEYMELSISATAFLQERLGFRPSVLGLFQGDDTAHRIENKMLESLTHAATTQVNEASAIVEDDLHHLWKQLADRMQQHFNFRLRVGTETGEPDWTRQKAHMRERLTKTIRDRLPDLNLREVLHKRLARRRWGVALFTLAALAIGVAGALAPFLLAGPLPGGPVIFGVVVAALVVVTAICGGIFAHQTGSEAIDRLGERFEEERSAMTREIKNALSEEVDGFFDDFLALFAPLHELCEEHRKRYQPQLREMEDLNRAFDEINELIGEPPPPEPEPEESYSNETPELF